jgi:hypothetical protein
MGSVGSSSALCSSVDGDVVDGEVFKVFSIGVGFQIVDQSEDNSDRLFRPSTESFSEFSSLSSSSDPTKVFEVGYTSSVSKNILEVLFSLGDGESLNGVGSLIGVFIVNSEVLGGGSGDYISEEVPLLTVGFLE